MPYCVRFALVLLGLAWLSSTCALAAHYYEVHASGADEYTVIGTLAALLQILLIHLLSRRNRTARIIVLGMAIPALLIAVFFFSGGISSFRLAAETVLRGSALLLLLTPGASRWFKKPLAAEEPLTSA